MENNWCIICSDINTDSKEIDDKSESGTETRIYEQNTLKDSNEVEINSIFDNNEIIQKKETKKLRKINIEDCHKLAAKYNGACLSKTCKNSRDIIHWICKKGHKWRQPYHVIKAAKYINWCKLCRKEERQINKKPGRKPLQIPNLHSYALSKNGICYLPEDYKKDDITASSTLIK
jgi:hypothetical protein